MNNVTLLGRLTKDIDLKYAADANQTAFARFTLAVDRKKDKDGNRAADFIPCIVWGKPAETMNQYFSKGSQVCIQGSIRTGSYKDKSGQTRYTTDVLVNSFYFVGNKAKDAPAPAPADDDNPYAGFNADADDIPF